MKKKISTLLVATLSVCMAMHSARASLLGMPLNLKAAILLAEVDAPVAACQFYTDDVLLGPVLVKGC